MMLIKKYTIKIKAAVVDSTAAPNMTVTNNGELTFSDSENVLESTVLSTKYAVLDNNYTVLDGNYSLPIRGGSFDYQKYVGDEISALDGSFVTSPALTFTSTLTHSILGLGIIFDSRFYPKKIRVVASLSSVDGYDKTFDNINTSNFVIDEPIADFDTLKIYFLEHYTQYHARMEQIEFGLMQTYDTGNLTSFSIENTVNMASLALPKDKFTFTLKNADGEFDLENPTGVPQYITGNQIIQYDIYYDGAFVKTVYRTTTGGVSSSNQDITITCGTAIDLMTDVYYKGMYYLSGRSLYDLALDILQFNYPDATYWQYNKWNIDSSLSSIVSLAPLPVKASNILLQYIANAAGCLLYVDNNGYINIAPPNITNTGKTIDFDVMSAKPSISQIPPLKNLSVNYYEYTVDSSTTTIDKRIETTGAFSVQFSYSQMYNMSIGIVNGTITTSEVYAGYAIVTGTATTADCVISITGYKLSTTQSQYIANYNAIGVDHSEIDNPLITDVSRATAINVFVGDYLEERNTYTAGYTGDVEILAGDVVSAESEFSSPNTFDAVVISNKLSYNGVLSGNVKMIKKE
jgi:hypothetical protein